MDITELSSSLRESVSGLHKRMRKQMNGVSAYSMTEVETIAHLARNTSLLPTELAMLTRITTQSMSQILKKFEEQGIVTRTPSKDDKRKVYIAITNAGKKFVEQARHDKDEWLKKAIELSLTEKEKDLLVKVMPVLNKLMETK